MTDEVVSVDRIVDQFDGARDKPARQRSGLKFRFIAEFPPSVA
jgi:hypothetical protein